MAQSFARFCSRCGNKITRVQKFCSKCGANVAKMSPVSTQCSSIEEDPAGLSEQSAFESSEAPSSYQDSEGPVSKPPHHSNKVLSERASCPPQGPSEESEQCLSPAQIAHSSAVLRSSGTGDPLSGPGLDEPDDLQAEEEVTVSAQDWSGEQPGHPAAELEIVHRGESENDVLPAEGAKEQPMTPLPESLVLVADDQAVPSVSQSDGVGESDLPVEQVPTQMLSQTPLPFSLSEEEAQPMTPLPESLVLVADDQAVPSVSQSDGVGESDLPVEQVPTQMLSQTPLPSSLSEALPVQSLPKQLLDDAGRQQEQTVAQASSFAQGQPLLLPSTPQPMRVDVSIPQLLSRSLVSWRPARKGVLGWRRVVSFSLLLIVVLGGGIWAVVWLNTPRQPPITTTNLGTTVKYAGVDVTLVNAQRAKTFIDDPQAVSDGMLRLKLRAQNKTNVHVNLQYATIAHIVLPTGKVLAPLHLVTSNGQLNPNATLTHLIDFALPQNIHIDHVKFALGSADEAQLVIPLDGRANVDQYTPKIVALKLEAITFYGLSWTLTGATTQWYIDGLQAKKGLRYLTLTMKVDNSLKQKAIVGSAYTYAQLQVSNTSMSLINSTLPVAFDSGVTGEEGTLTFQVPQDTTSFTLVLSKPADGFEGTSITFQIS